MKGKINNLNDVITATKNQYKQHYNKECTDADSLVEYAGLLSNSNEFAIWDESFDNDTIAGNNLSGDRYFASKKNILFQTESDSKKATGTVSCYDITTGEMKDITDRSAIFDLLYSMNGGKNNTLTDSNSNILTKEKFLNNSKLTIKLTKDGFEFTNYDKDLDTRASGDPHYYANNKFVFDHQGKAGNEYLELNSDEMQIVSKRGTASNGSTVIFDESIELKGSNITVVAHKNGKYDVHYIDENNKDVIIMNQDGAQVSNADKILSKAGITVNLSGVRLSVGYKDRTANLDLTTSCINDYTASEYGDTGLRSQVAGAYDQKTEHNEDGTITINNQVYSYDDTQQNMVTEDKGHTTYNLERSITVSGKKTTVRNAILADLAKIDTDGTIDGNITSNGSKKSISLASAFNSNSGYTAAEFNELIGELIYSADNKYI